MSRPGALFQRFMYNMRRFTCDCLCSLGLLYKYPHHIIFLSGMALSGSTWIKNMLARIPGYYTRFSPMPRDIANRQDIVDVAFKRVPQRGYTLFKTHLNPTVSNLECIKQNGVEKIIVSYRDLRDVVVSDYYRNLEFPNPEDVCGFVDCNTMTREEAIDLSIERVHKFFVPWIRGWIKIAQVDPESYHFIKFEDLKNSPHAELKKMLSFYGIDLDDTTVNRIILETQGRGNVKDNIESAKVLPWGYSSNFRSGKIGSWRQEFSSQHIIKARRLLGEILIELGYEQDDKWANIK